MAAATLLQRLPVPLPTTPSVIPPSGTAVIDVYGTTSAVAAATTTTVVTYTVPASTDFYLERIEVSGSNVAEFMIELNTVEFAKKRTYWTIFNVDFEFNSRKFVAGDILRVRVIHQRPEVGDFEARINGTEVS